jgi:tetratricopeptide (TPR) repeat protein
MKWMRLICSCLVCIGCVSMLMTHSADARRKPKKKKEAPVEVLVDSAQQARKHLFFGSRYLKNKQYEDAETQLTRSWDYDQSNGKTAYYLGKLAHETEKYDEAVSWFEKGIELAPESKNTQNAYYFIAQIYVLRQERLLAIDTYKKLLTYDSDHETKILYVHALVSLYVEEGDYESALTYARQWSELEPDNADVRDTVAKLALSTGEEDEAMEEMERLFQMNPSDFATLERLAGMYVRQGATTKAFEAYQKLRKNQPSNYLFLDQALTLGKQLGKSKSFRTSTLKKMLALQPQNLNVIEQLADETGAMSMVERGLKLDGRNGKLLYMKGQFYYRKWKDAGAKQDSVRALQWFRKAQNDPQWAGNAKRMIDEIDPPMTEEEKKLQEFFKKKAAKDEVDVKGKK